MENKKYVFIFETLWSAFNATGPQLGNDHLFHFIHEKDLEEDPNLLVQVEGVVLYEIDWDANHEYIHRMPRLKAITSCTTGVDATREFLEKGCACVTDRKLALGHAPGSNADTTANFATMLILASVRELLSSEWADN